MQNKTALLILLFVLPMRPLFSQNPQWEKHTFESYEFEFKTPSNWNVTINDRASQIYVECYSPDNQIYFFITSAENEKKSSPDIVLSYLKVTYENCEFIREESKKINNVDFVFSSGINRMSEIQTYIKLGVGKHKDRIYMIDSGYSEVNSEEADNLLNEIINSVKAIH
ncbi:hypothetical protein JNM05_10485 [bacterium]|nr:hypothetical protein [bacterium]